MRVETKWAILNDDEVSPALSLSHLGGARAREGGGALVGYKGRIILFGQEATEAMDSFGWKGRSLRRRKERGREGRMEAAAIQSRRWKERRKLDAYF